MSLRIRLVVRAGPTVGRGHAGRAIALGAALAGRGADVAIEVLDGELAPGERARAVAAGVRVGPGDHGPDEVVVLDVPDPNERADVDPDRLVVFDDRNLLTGDARVVVQPSRTRWQGAAAARVVLAGYAYAPVDPRYVERRAAIDAARVAPAPAGSRRVVVCFGGSDPHDVTARVADAVIARLPDTDVVVGATYRGRYDGPRVVRDPGDLPDRIAAATAVLMGAGTMKFEVACLGRPAALLAASDDQVPVAPEYAATGAAVDLGDGRTCDPDVVAAEVAALVADQPRRERMGAVAAGLVDGRGADRIADALVRAFGPIA